MGYDAGTGERNLKRWAKGVSKTARKCGQAMFMEQTASRVTERLVIAKAMFFIEASNGLRKKSKNQSHRKLHNGSWQYTRKDPHLLYDLQTRSATLNECKVIKNRIPQCC